MKKRELTELKNKTIAEVDKTVADLHKKRLEVEVKMASGKESNLKALKHIRRDIAQAMTLLRLKAMDGQAIQGIIKPSRKKKGEEVSKAGR